MPGRRIAGYSLLELLIAIAIVGMALLVSSNALQAHAALARRTEVRQQMQRAVEDVMESLRGDVIPLENGPVRLVVGRGSPMDSRIRTVVSVEPAEIEGLFDVHVVARTHSFGEPMALELNTKVWRP
jgi:prepilin-type N-terminal cleavage/methylation domain-containing protein